MPDETNLDETCSAKQDSNTCGKEEQEEARLYLDGMLMLKYNWYHDAAMPVQFVQGTCDAPSFSGQ